MSNYRFYLACCSGRVCKTLSCIAKSFCSIFWPKTFALVTWAVSSVRVEGQAVVVSRGECPDSVGHYWNSLVHRWTWQLYANAKHCTNMSQFCCLLAMYYRSRNDKVLLLHSIPPLACQWNAVVVNFFNPKYVKSEVKSFPYKPLTIVRQDDLWDTIELHPIMKKNVRDLR